MASLCLLLLLLSAAAYGAGDGTVRQDWGRLFTTPAERAQLEAQRTTAEGWSPAVPAAGMALAEAPPAATISMQGYVKPGDGSDGTVWVNDAPLQEHSTIGALLVGSVRSDRGQVRLELANGKPVDLKAGQTYLPMAGDIIDLAAHGETASQDSSRANRQAGR